MRANNRRWRPLAWMLVLTTALLTSACGGGGGDPRRPGGAAGDRGALLLAARPGAGSVVHNVLEQGDRYEMILDPIAQEVQVREMLPVMAGTWIYGWALYEFRTDGYWRRVDSDPFGFMTLYTVGHYYRAGSSTPLQAAAINMQFDPQFVVVIDGGRLGIAHEDPYGETQVDLFGRY